MQELPTGAHLSVSLAALNNSHSEAASSTATGSSMQEQTCLRLTSSCTHFDSTTTQADSQSTSTRGLKRSAAALDLSLSQKRVRAAQLGASPNPPLQSCATVSSPPCPPGMVTQEQHAHDSNKAASSPSLGQRPEEDEEPRKQGTRPTPVPITPEGGQPDMQHLLRHKVKTGCTPAHNSVCCLCMYNISSCPNSNHRRCHSSTCV